MSGLSNGDHIISVDGLRFQRLKPKPVNIDDLNVSDEVKYRFEQDTIEFEKRRVEMLKRPGGEWIVISDSAITEFQKKLKKTAGKKKGPKDDNVEATFMNNVSEDIVGSDDEEILKFVFDGRQLTGVKGKFEPDLANREWFEITAVEPNTWASEQPILIGDRVLAVDDLTPKDSGVEPQIWVQMLKREGAIWTVARFKNGLGSSRYQHGDSPGAGIDSESDGEEDERLPGHMVQIPKYEKKSGVTGKFISKNINTSGAFEISAVTTGGWGHRNGLKARDLLVAVDGKSFALITGNERIELLQMVDSVVSVIISPEEGWKDESKKLSKNVEEPTSIAEALAQASSPTGLARYFYPLKYEGKTGCEGKFDKETGEFLVTEIINGEWAETAGIRVGDTVVAVNGIQFSSANDQERIHLMQMKSAQYKVRIAEITVSPEDGRSSVPRGYVDGETMEKIRPTAPGMSPKGRYFFPVKYEGKTGCQGKFDKPSGEFIVKGIDPASWAERAGIREGDAICAVGPTLKPF